jgi:hypothetical protein
MKTFKLNSGLEAKFLEIDDWGREIYLVDDRIKCVLLKLDEYNEEKNELIYKDTLYSLTLLGEPDCPLKEKYQPENRLVTAKSRKMR